MGERAYFHHAKIVTGAMVGAAVARAVRAGEIEVSELYEIGDEVLLWRLRESAVPEVRKLAGSLASRKVFRPIFERHRGEIRAEQQSARDRDVLEALMREFHDDAGARIDAEDRMAELFGMDPADLLVHCPHYEMSMKVAEILVFWNGALRPLADCTDDALVGARSGRVLRS